MIREKLICWLGSYVVSLAAFSVLTVIPVLTGWYNWWGGLGWGWLAGECLIAYGLFRLMFARLEERYFGWQKK